MNLHIFQAILDGERTYEQFIRNFLSVMYPKGDVPIWTVEALAVAGTEIQTTCVPGVKGEKKRDNNGGGGGGGRNKDRNDDDDDG